MNKICRTCGSMFSTKDGRRVYCSEECVIAGVSRRYSLSVKVTKNPDKLVNAWMKSNPIKVDPVSGDVTIW